MVIFCVFQREFLGYKRMYNFFKYCFMRNSNSSDNTYVAELFDAVSC